MKMRNQTLLVALIFLLFPMLIFAQSNLSPNSTLNVSSNSTLNASSVSPAVSNATIIRNCSFVLVLNALPAYERIGNLTINYTLQKKTANNCTVDTISGNVVIMQLDNSNVILTQNLTAQNVTTSPSSRNVIFGTDQFANTSYSATVAFNFDGKVSSSSRQFTFYNPQNLTLSSLNPHFSLTQSSPITFRFGTINIGQYTSGNFTLFVNITSFTDSVPIFQGQYNQTSLLPFQNATYSITIPNATQEAGGYRVSAYETYKVANQTRITNVAASLYSVQEQLGAAGGSRKSGQPLT